VGVVEDFSSRGQCGDVDGDEKFEVYVGAGEVWRERDGMFADGGLFMGEQCFGGLVV
jgi:hypothetical protein